MKAYVFGSLENFGRTVLVLLIIWVFFTMVAFFKALAFSKKSASTNTLTNLGIGIGAPVPVVGPSAGDVFNDALRITGTVSVFIFILEMALFVLLLISF